jgi:hypothetical protein
MPDQTEEFIALIKAGKIAEARATVEALKKKVKYSPDTFVQGKPPRFWKRGKPVELGEDGNWRLKK